MKKLNQGSNKKYSKSEQIDIELAHTFLNPQEIEKKKINDKISQEEKVYLSEEESIKINSNVFKREIFNDSMQLPIKYLAFYLSGTGHGGTFLAELIRSGIDAINHLLIYATNYINIRPTKEYPYGLDKVKNIVVMLPASLFLMFGIETMYSSIHGYFFEVAEEAASTQNIYSVLLYILSLGIELTVISYNLIDVYKSQNTGSDQQTNISFMQVIKALLKKKDPLLQVILFENAITLTSQSIPLFCGIASFFTATQTLEFIGTTCIGGIQIFCGYHLAKENIYPLIGRGLEEEQVEQIKDIIKGNEFVYSVSKEKAVLISHSKFRFFAELTFNVNQLGQMIINEYSQTLENIVYSKDYEEREEELKDLIFQLPVRLLKEIQRQKEIIENSIFEQYPECVHIDLELDQQLLLDIFEDDENLKNFFFESLKESKSNIDNININQNLKWEDLDKVNNQFLEETIDKYLNIDTQILKKQIVYNNLSDNGYEPDTIETNYVFDRENEKFYSQNISSLYTEEFNIIHQEVRQAVIDMQINEPEICDYWQNIENPVELIKESIYKIDQNIIRDHQQYKYKNEQSD